MKFAVKLTATIFVGVLLSSCTHDYWRMKQESEELRMKHTHVEDVIDKCATVCGLGNVKLCSPHAGQIECYQSK